MTKVGLYAIGKSTTLESNKSHPERRQHKLPPFYQCTPGPGDFGPAGDQVESSLARGPSEVLGVQADACRPSGNG